MHARSRGPNNLILKEPDFPCLADEIAEPRPDIYIYIIVAAFTVSEKSINTMQMQKKKIKIKQVLYSFCFQPLYIF